jgi:hypothetical protein
VSSSRRHSAHHSVAKPCSSRPQCRKSRSTRPTTGRSGPWERTKRRGQQQQLLQMAFDELAHPRPARLPRPLDPASDLHAQPRAGGRVAGRIGRRTTRLSRGRDSPSPVPGEVRIAALTEVLAPLPPPSSTAGRGPGRSRRPPGSPLVRRSPTRRTGVTPAAPSPYRTASRR